MEYKLKDLIYGGKYHDAFWGEENIFVSITNCLANCTCEVYGDCLATGTPVPISKTCNANNFHKNLTNGWTCLDFDRSKISVGDIIEWTDGCHVARVAKIENGTIYLNCSWYTGIHGVAVYNGSWDTRPFSSLKEVSDFMSTNYPTRFYHCWDLDREINGVGYQPRYVLKMPNSIPSDGQNTDIDQIHVLTNEQNVRVSPSTKAEIVGVAQEGYYDVLGSQTAENYVWYATRYGWIAGVDKRVVFIEADTDIKKLKKRIAELEKENGKLRNAINKAIKDLEV